MTKYLSDDTRVDAVAGALANRSRRAALDRLCRGPATTSGLADLVGAALPTMHQHLRILRDAGLVRSKKRGRTVTYTLVPESLEPMQRWIETRRSFWTSQLDAMADAAGGRHER